MLRVLNYIKYLCNAIYYTHNSVCTHTFCKKLQPMFVKLLKDDMYVTCSSSGLCEHVYTIITVVVIFLTV